MIRFVAALFLSLAAPALAQDTAVPPAAAAPPATATEPAPGPKPATVRVRLTTSEGVIDLELEKQRAPLTTANFLRYVDQKRLDGTSFYRATKVGSSPTAGLIQGGVRGDPKRVLKPVAHEATSVTGLTHADGTISMARAAPGSATGDFFITVGALTSLDANPALPGDSLGFAAFGHVVAGMDVVGRILDAPTSAAGAGVMKGQMLAVPVRIITARRE
ncbi:MAG: peptidylprolyl isomerase [Janthinobacterium lividum]